MRWPLSSLLAIAALLGTTQPAWAASNGPCEGAYQNRHMGWQETGSKQGAEATFPGLSLLKCTTINATTISGSFAFANVEGPATGSGYNIVQIGYGTCRRPLSVECDGVTRWFWAWGRDSVGPSCGNKLPLPENVGVWDGTTSTYRVSHVGSTWRGYVDGVQKASIPDTYLSCSWSAQYATWFSESWNYGDALGGTQTNKFGITNMKYQNVAGGSWVAVSANASGPCRIDTSETPPFYCDVIGTDDLQTWTNR